MYGDFILILAVPVPNSNIPNLFLLTCACGGLFIVCLIFDCVLIFNKICGNAAWPELWVI